jgi:SAM-dependent methyltransferase
MTAATSPAGAPARDRSPAGPKPEADLLEALTRLLPAGAERLLVADARRSPWLAALVPLRGGPDRPLAWGSDGSSIEAGPGEADAAAVVGALERAARPDRLLASLARALAPGGTLLLAIPNAQHHAAVAALLRGDVPAFLCDGRTPLRPLTFSAAEKMLLDAGLVGGVLATTPGRTPEPLAEAARPLLEHLRADAFRTRMYLDAPELVLSARPFDPGPGAADVARQEPITFVACVNDEAQLRDNLLASPCLGPGTPHEVLLVRDAPSAAEGLGWGRERARHDLVVCLHQDMYLPAGWPARFRAQLREAERRFGPVGVAGVYGLERNPEAPDRSFARGRVVDRHQVLQGGDGPSRVHSLDEIVLAFPRGSPLRLDPALGWHFYGADVAWAAQKHGRVAVAVDAPCLHNSLGGPQVPQAFFESAAVFREKWRADLPIQTSCAVVRP